jgi:hypothetical protein
VKVDVPIEEAEVEGAGILMADVMDLPIKGGEREELDVVNGGCFIEWVGQDDATNSSI